MTDQNFKDYFSTQSADYARFRPRYPEALFAWLADISPGKALAWDCATGNGQAAVGLAAHFARVVATDASAAQIAGAEGHERIEYRVAPAEASGLPDASTDLVTVAQALHWFDLEHFYGEVRRVLKPGGVVAAWCYNLLSISPEVDAQLNDFYFNVVGPYWPPERKYLERAYADLPFPFARIDAPAFAMEAEWTLAQLLGYLGTWSATVRYQAERGADPRITLAAELARLWPAAEGTRRVRWPLAVLVGRV
ncbi:MAG: class I SAM-dependent methyltransferase [Pseudomonadota bacterium]|jgi:SAM-dependent methyltransferase